MIERVATEFNKLQFYVNKSRGLPLVDNIRPVSRVKSYVPGFEVITENNVNIIQEECKIVSDIYFI